MHEREYGSSGGGGGSGYDYGPFGDYGPFRGFAGQYRQSGGSSAQTEDELHMQAAANFINSGHYQEALNLLNGIKTRNAQWYFYSAAANSGVGNNVIALQYAQEALRRDPGNLQYQMLVRQLESGGMWYEQRQGPYQTTFYGGSSWCHEALHRQHRLQPVLRRRTVLRQSLRGKIHIEIFH